MKRLIFRFAALLMIVTASFLLYDSPTAEATSSCWETLYNKWQNCDDNYSSTLTAHAFAPQTCDNSAYSSCIDQYPIGSPSYNACYGTTYNSCVNQDQQNYDNRGSSYGSCIGIEGNAANCVEQLSGGCQLANQRALSCGQLYPDSEDADAYSTCLNNSGALQCQ